MSDRLEQLQLRRRQLLLRSERLRADLAADQQVMLDALSGVDRAVSTARKFAPPVLLIAAGAVLFGFFRRPRNVATAATSAGRRAGFAAKALFWISMVRRVMPYVPLIKALWRSRFSQRARPEDWAESAQ